MRSFTKWLHGIDPRTEVPPTGLIPGRQRRPRPYIYTDAEIVRIVTEAARLPSDYGLRALGCSTLFGLLAVTGLRVGEAVRLDDRDVDLDADVLHVRYAKNRNSRVIPITASTAEHLGACRAARNRILGAGALPFFASDSGQRLTTHTARYNLAQVCQQIGLRERQSFRRNGHGPRLHDMRHSMAVKTMLDWYRKGLNPDREMHKLSTYLGHTSPNHTYWYMEAVPELLALASERAEWFFSEGEEHENASASHLPAAILHRAPRQPAPGQPHTVASYRDTFRLLLTHASERLARMPTDLQVADIDAELVGHFLNDIETTRGNSARTRNTRLSAIRSFFKYVAINEPQLLHHCQKVLAMPPSGTKSG